MKNISSKETLVVQPGMLLRECILFAGVLLFISLSQAAQAGLSPNAKTAPAMGKTGIVASAHRLATEAGLQVLKKGGNAVDAAVAAAFCLGVVEPYASGIGGGGFMLIYLAETGEVSAIDYRESAPMRTPRGTKDTGPFEMGPRSIAVPGTMAGLSTALDRYGTMTLKDVLEPAIRLAEEGFAVSGLFVDFVNNYSWKIAKFPELATLYLKPGYRAGDRFFQKDLARTYRLIAEKGPDIFYRGELAEAIAAEVERSGGWLTRRDLAAYKALARKPVKGSYRKHEIYSMPPPSSGGVHVIELLNIMAGYDAAALGYLSARGIQVMAEAMRRVFRDRARFMGDPDFVRVPVGELVSQEHAGKIRNGITKGRVNRKIKMPAGIESDQTTHISVADGRGNLVALTQTLNSFFGSGILVPGTGILLNNEMKDFVKTGPNAAAPGKRPVSSISPTLVLKSGKPFMSLGMAGATRIISGLPQIIMDVIDFGMSIQEAIDAPRFYCASETIAMESRIPEGTRAALAAMGYGIEVRRAFDLYFGGAQGVLVDSGTGTLYGGADPRRQGYAAGY